MPSHTPAEKAKNVRAAASMNSSVAPGVMTAAQLGLQTMKNR